MRVVIDEGVPRRLVGLLRDAGIDAHRFPPDWRGLTNGRLLETAEAAGFDRLITGDRNMAFQTNLRNRRISVIALPTNRIDELTARVADIATTILLSSDGRHLIIHRDGRRTTREATGSTHEEIELPPIAPFGSAGDNDPR